MLQGGNRIPSMLLRQFDPLGHDGIYPEVGLIVLLFQVLVQGAKYRANSMPVQTIPSMNMVSLVVCILQA